jgi:hypothetical protein
MTYKERVQQMSKIHADRYNQGGRREYAGGPLLKNDPEHMEDEAEVTIAAQAEAIIEQLQPYRSNGFIDKLLIDNGYKPLPEILKMEVPVNYKCPECHNEYMVDDTGTYCDNNKCSRFWDTKL